MTQERGAEGKNVGRDRDQYQDRIQAWLEAVPMRMRSLAFLRAQSSPVYLVGGSVRDALLGRPAHDMDLVIDGDALHLTRALADHLDAAFVPMDVERDVGRVAWHDAKGVQYVDLAGFRASTLTGDLLARDFTANAIAVPLMPTVGFLIDPAHGKEDIAQRLLRATTPQVFVNDPLRILRGLRQSGALGFGIETGTEQLMRSGRHGLSRVSPERIRDELFQIAELPDSAAVLARGAEIGVWEIVFVQAETSDEGRRIAGRLDGVMNGLKAGANGPLGSYVTQLERHWSAYTAAERSRGTLLKLVAWLGSWMDDDKALCALKGLHLSRRELAIAEYTLQAQSDDRFWLDLACVSDLDLYRYFRAYGDAGLDGAVLWWTTRGAPHNAPRLDLLFDAWFCRHETVIDPPALVNGRDLIVQAGLSPGPLLGETLEAIRQAQVQGRVTSREQALDYARRKGAGAP